jgi:hypothetical protein
VAHRWLTREDIWLLVYCAAAMWAAAGAVSFILKLFA